MGSLTSHRPMVTPGPSPARGRTRRSRPTFLLGLAVLPLLLALTPPTEPPTQPPPTTPTPERVAVVPITRGDGEVLSPLALAGRAVFLREGCQVCHAVAPSTVVPRLPDEERVTVPGKQAAPQLWALPGDFSPSWQARHLQEPRSVRARSIMPAYRELLSAPVKVSTVSRVTELLVRLSPGSSLHPAKVAAAIDTEGQELAARVVGVDVGADSDLVAVLAYLEQIRSPSPGTPDGAKPTPARKSRRPR